MSETMALLNPAYFSGYAGDLREEIIQSDHYAMWRKHSGFAPIGYTMDQCTDCQSFQLK